MRQHVVEGTWEEIARYAEEFKGQRMRVTVLTGEDAGVVEPVDAMGWPVGFFEETFGSLADDPLERLPQGEHDERDPLA